MSLLLIALLQLYFFQHVMSACSTTSDVEFTFYGFPDASSATTSFGCSGTKQVAYGTAGGKYPSISPPLHLHRCLYSHPQGSGSYAQPETFATTITNTNFIPCEIIYIPLLQKYFQYMDHCDECATLYPSTIRIDLWVGTAVNGGQKQTACELALGLKEAQTIVRDPPATLQVNPGQIWDNENGACGDGTMVFPDHPVAEADVCGPGSVSPSPPAGSAAVGSAPLHAPKPSLPPTSSDTIAPPAIPQPPTSPSPPPTYPLDPPIKLPATTAGTPSPTTLTTSATPYAFSSRLPTPRPKCEAAPCPCHDFNDCPGDLICQGWPDAVCVASK